MKKEVISKFYQNYKLYVFPAVVILSSLILIILVIYPQVSKILADQKTEGEFLTKWEFLEAKAQDLESYDSQDLLTKVNLALISYPVEKDFVIGIGLMQNLTAAAGFSITSLILSPGVSKSQSYGIKLDILGPGVLLPSLLSDIENSPRLMRISNVETSAGADHQLITASLNVDILYSSAPGDFGTVDSPILQLSQEDEQALAKIAKVRASISQPSQTQTPTQFSPRGKSNPFE